MLVTKRLPGELCCYICNEMALNISLTCSNNNEDTVDGFGKHSLSGNTANEVLVCVYGNWSLS